MQTLRGYLKDLIQQNKHDVLSLSSLNFEAEQKLKAAGLSEWGKRLQIDAERNGETQVAMKVLDYLDKYII